MFFAKMITNGPNGFKIAVPPSYVLYITHATPCILSILVSLTDLSGKCSSRRWRKRSENWKNLSRKPANANASQRTTTRDHS